LALAAITQGSVAFAQPGGTFAAGWTYFPPDPRSHSIYVSSSSGSDTNDGSSSAAAVQTLARGYELLRDGSPDWLLLKCGDTWNEAFPYWDKSANSDSGYMVVSSYGAGERPLIISGQDTGIGSAPTDPRRGIAVIGLHLAADGSGLGQGAGVGFIGNWGNVLIEDCLIEKYPTNIVVQEVSPDQRLPRITVRRCVIVDSLSVGTGHSQGIFLGSCDDWLIEECVLDRNGAVNADQFCHNVYIHESCGPGTFRGNISARACSHGVQQRPGGTCENNLMLRNPLGILIGHSAYAPTVFNTVRNNVVLDAADINITMPRGTGIELNDVGRATVERNIVAHQEHGTGNLAGMSFADAQNLTIRNNIVYQWTVPGFGFGAALSFAGTTSAVTISGNMLQQVLGGVTVSHEPSCPYSPDFAYSGNRYFSINPLNGYLWFANAGTFLDIAGWGALTHEVGASYSPVSFPDPNRTIEAYAGSKGLAPTLDAFMAQARLQSRQQWRSAYTAAVVGAWVRHGFGIQCRADYNGDGVVNILDFLSFSNDFQAGAPGADINGDGVLNILDFAAFVQIAAAGC
jgi:hypothetical protein